MLSSLLLSQLNAVLCQVFETISRQQVEASLLGGKLVLKKLRLKERILASYSLPICVTYGVLKELRVQVNWFRLLSHPVVVEADGLLVVATTIPTNEWDVAVERDNLSEQKKLRLATDEVLTYAKIDRSIATRFLYKLAYTLIGRVECNENWEPYRGQGGLDSSLAPLRGEQGLYDETSADEETAPQTDYCFFPPAAKPDHHQHRCCYGDSCDVQSRRRAGKSSSFRPSFAPGFPNSSLWTWTKRLITASISSLSGGSDWPEESSSWAGFATLSQTDEILFRKIVVAGSAIYIDSLTPAGPCSPWLPQPASARKALLLRLTKMRAQAQSSQRWSSDLSDPHRSSQHAVRPTGPTNKNHEKPDILHDGAEQLSPDSNYLHNDDLRGLSNTPPSVSSCGTDCTDSVEQGNPGSSLLPPKSRKHYQPHQEDCRVSPRREDPPRRREDSSNKGEQRAEKGSSASQRRPFESRQYRRRGETRDGQRKAGEHPVADTEVLTGSRTDEWIDRSRHRVARRRGKLTGFESADFASNGDAPERILARRVVDNLAGALRLDGGCDANGVVDSVRDPQDRTPVSVCNGDPQGTTPLSGSKATQDETGRRRCEDDTDMDNPDKRPLLTVYDLYTHEEMTLRAEASAPQHQYLYRPGRLELRVRMLSRPAQAVPGSFAFSDRIFYRPLRAIADLGCFSKVFRGSRGDVSARKKQPPAEEQRNYFLAWRRRLLAKTSTYLGTHGRYSQLKSFLQDTLGGTQAATPDAGLLSSLLDETDEVTTEPLSFPLNALAPRRSVPGVNALGHHPSPCLQSPSEADERQNENGKARGTAEAEGRVATHVHVPILAERMPPERQAELRGGAGVPEAMTEAPEELSGLLPPFMESNAETNQGHNDTEPRGGDVERGYRRKTRHDRDDQCIAAFEETYWVDDILRIRTEALESLKGLMQEGEESQDQVKQPENAAPTGRTKKKKKRGDHSRLRGAGLSFWDQDRNKRGKQNKSLSLEKTGQMPIRTVGSNVGETPFRREEDGRETPSDLFFYPAQESPSLCENSGNPTTFATLDSPAESWTIWGTEEKNSSLEKRRETVPGTGPVCEDDSAPVRFTSSPYSDKTCRGAEASPPQRTAADDTDEVNQKTGNSQDNIVGRPSGDRPPSCVSSIFRDRVKEASISSPLDAPLSWQMGSRESAATVNGHDEEETGDFWTGDEYSGQEEQDTEEEEAAVRLRPPPSCSRAHLRKNGRSLFDEGRSSTCVAFQDVSIEDFLSPDLAHRTVLRTLAPPEAGCPFLAGPSSLGSASLSSPLASLPSPCYASSALPCTGPLPGGSGQRSVCSHGGSSSSSAHFQSTLVAGATDAEQAAERDSSSCNPRVPSSTYSRWSTGCQHKATSYVSSGLTRPDPTSPSLSAQCVSRGAERDRGNSSGEEPLPSFSAVTAWTPHPYSGDSLCSGAAASRRLSSPASPPSSSLGSSLPSPPFRPPRLEARSAASGLFSSFFGSAAADPGPAMFPPSQGDTQGGWLRWDMWAKRQKSTPDSLLYVHLKDSILVTLSPAAALRMVQVLLKALEPMERRYLLARMEGTAREAVTRQETYLAEMALGNSSHSCSDLCVVLEAPCRLLLPFHESIEASEGLLFSCGAVCVDSHLQLPRVDATELSASSFSPLHSSSESSSRLGAPLSMRATSVQGNTRGWASAHANSTTAREIASLPGPSGDERREEHERLRIGEKPDEWNMSGAKQQGKNMQSVPAVSPFPSLLLCSERLFDRYAFGCGDCTVLRVGNASAFDYFLSFACTCSSCGELLAALSASDQATKETCSRLSETGLAVPASCRPLSPSKPRVGPEGETDERNRRGRNDGRELWGRDEEREQVVSGSSLRDSKNEQRDETSTADRKRGQGRSFTFSRGERGSRRLSDSSHLLVLSPSAASPSERVYRGNEGIQREENKMTASKDRRRHSGEKRSRGSRVSPLTSVHAESFPTHGRHTLTDSYSSSEQVLGSSTSSLRTRKGERDTLSALVSSPALGFEYTEAGTAEKKQNVDCPSPSSLHGSSLPHHEDSSPQGLRALLPSDTVNVLDEVPGHEISLNCMRLRKRSTNTPGCRSGHEASDMRERRRAEGAEKGEGVSDEEKPSEERKGKRERDNAENTGDKGREASTESPPRRRRVSSSADKRSSQRGDHSPLYLLYPTSFRLFVDVCHLTRAQGLPAFRLMLRDDNLIGYDLGVA
ncbi:amine-terminal region of chorein, A TM vesicle-mediated sorter [Toxoplasma gondii CAST]|uniref:Amine-terminal region of chorein, A TM vesicle-mediated sorter n=1 Tax=Toxoplasma gondii CAST TaxID=943122 RepID=A0A425HN21_TOXGO|nr:amine-terminal region of chorein, A TM vesicle-mediated sorter [Toxoplasma gondii CAST]